MKGGGLSSSLALAEMPRFVPRRSDNPSVPSPIRGTRDCSAFAVQGSTEHLPSQWCLWEGWSLFQWPTKIYKNSRTNRTNCQVYKKNLNYLGFTLQLMWHLHTSALIVERLSWLHLKCSLANRNSVASMASALDHYQCLQVQALVGVMGVI